MPIDPTAPRPLLGVGVAVFDASGRVLLLRRRGSHGAGTWALVGGHVEYGQTPVDAMVAEVREEVGVDLSPDQFRMLAHVASDVFPTERRHYLTLFGVAMMPAGQSPRIREPDKASEIGWFGLAELPQPLFPPLASLLASGSLSPPS